MAQLEKFFSGSFVVGANDNAIYAVTGFPVIPANSSVLVTGVYFNFAATYAANVSGLYVNNGGSVPVYLSASGSRVDNSVPIISSNSQFIMHSATTLEFKLFNTNPGSLTINIFYRIIGGKNNADSLIYDSIIGSGNIPTSFDLGIGTNVAFVKSLIVTATSATDEFSLELTPATGSLKVVNCIQNVSNIMILGTEYLFIPSPKVLQLYSSGITDYSYYLSYYYDPLYTLI
jgi:hypothetical protein